MCGRFTLTVDIDVLLEQFQIKYPIGFDYQVRYNIAPSQLVTVVIKGEKGNKMGQLRWGLVPEWAKDPKIGYKMINARSETLRSKASFKQAFNKRRCLIIADGFYEWKREDGQKQPFRITVKDRKAFAFAGLWSTWESDAEKLSTCTIITTGANRLMQNLHHRMPIILSPEDQETWLDPRTDLQTLEGLLTQYPEELMTYYPVSDAVNSAKNEEPSLLEKV
ncbi:SOS response-associated peptidase [Pullulanibacillus pueri]|uniref:Abasic site processing protein n=1 Tax=Pullulanibacillus pueri TaxID=1437324 RepID=A0A8J2ZZG4_9BACL|nr:SOS response-associated peptidase [Pullulanibacillus pueri]GGH87541.1 putative SOS response-associated peptidase YoqW [Pullulanibacillus pueri]